MLDLQTRKPQHAILNVGSTVETELGPTIINYLGPAVHLLTQEKKLQNKNIKNGGASGPGLGAHWPKSHMTHYPTSNGRASPNRLVPDQFKAPARVTNSRN